MSEGFIAMTNRLHKMALDAEDATMEQRIAELVAGADDVTRQLAELRVRVDALEAEVRRWRYMRDAEVRRPYGGEPEVDGALRLQLENGA